MRCRIYSNFFFFFYCKTLFEINGRFAFIGIVIHHHFVLPMSLFIDLTFRLPNLQNFGFFRTIFGSAAFAVKKR